MFKNTYSLLIVGFFSLFSLWGQKSQAQTDSLEILYDLSTPQQSLTRHLFYLQEETYEPEVSASTISGDQSLNRKIEAAIQLLEIYNASGTYIDVSLAPNQADFIDTLNNQPRYQVLPEKFPQIYLEKYGDIWQYSESTIAALPTLYKNVIPSGAQWIKALVPEIGGQKFLGMKIWKWIGLLIISAICTAMYFLLRKLFAWSIRRIVPKVFSSALLNLDRVPPAAHVFSYLLTAIVLRMVFLPMLILPIGWSKPLYLIMGILISFLSIWFVFRAIDILADIFSSLAERTSTTLDNQLVPLLAKVSKLLTAVFGVIFILDNFDIDVTALLAGVSIGGLAVALAAQDTVRNFIGSITIFVDRPFTLGDFIEVAGITGTVVEVGVRSTRIRASEGSIVSIPNGDLANKIISNSSLREYRRYATSITVSYDTLPETMSNFVEGIRNIIISHPKTRDESVTVQFHEMSSSSLDIFYSAIFEETEYAGWLKARQEIFLEIMKLADEMKVGFAFPSTSVYIESMPENMNTHGG